MTSTTMELLERVLERQPDADLYKVRLTLERFRATGKAADEEALRKAAEEYLEEVKA